jgi:DNA primase
MAEVVRKLTHATSWHQAKEILKRYTTGMVHHRHPKQMEDRPTKVELPKGCGPLKKMHMDYLRGRNYDPHQLVREWGLQGTGHLGDYKFRIIAPIYVDGRLVSYQGRDITGKSSLPYMACRKADEVIHHQHTVYGLDQTVGDSVAIVEGVTDVWRLGPGAVSVFGIEFTPPQIDLISDRFKRITILFDEDPQAVEQTNLLVKKLKPLKIEVIHMVLDGVNDPAELSPEDAKRLMWEII